MKELSIEEKARKYDEAIKRVENIRTGKCETTFMFTECLFEHIFPELKESEDERIRKELIKIVNDHYSLFKEIDRAKTIAWLEKQGEKKFNNTDFSDLRTWKYIVDAVLTEKEGIGQYLDSPLTEEVAKKLQKRFGNIEQKPADKVEPKFKVGDWVVNNFGDVWHIDSFDKKNYQVSNGNEYNYFPISKQNEMYLWTIFQKNERTGYERDAEHKQLKKIEQKPADKVEPKFKVGDVIRLKGSAAEYTIKKVTDTTYYTNGWSCGIERCEEDYELVEQKPTAWSEKDKNMVRFIGNAITADEASAYLESKGIQVIDAHVWLDELKDRVQPKQEWSEDDEKMIAVIEHHLNNCGASITSILWFKSIKDRYSWKPSDEQMEALKSSTYCQNEQMSKVLFELYQDLKKLKE